MDFGDFRKAVKRAARDAESVAENVTPTAEAVAPAFKIGTMAAITIATGGAAAPYLPFLAPLPPQFFLPPAVSVPLFLFSQPFREGIAEHAEKQSAPQAASALVSHFLTPTPT